MLSTKGVEYKGMAGYGGGVYVAVGLGEVDEKRKHTTQFHNCFENASDNYWDVH